MCLIAIAGCFDSRGELQPLQPEPVWSEPFDMMFEWFAALSILPMIACGVLIIWGQIPSLVKWGWIGLTFFGGVIVSAMTFAVIKPYFPWIVLGGFVIGAAIGVWYLMRNWKTLREYVHKDEEQLNAVDKKMVELCKTQIDLVKP